MPWEHQQLVSYPGYAYHLSGFPRVRDVVFRPSTLPELPRQSGMT